MASATVNFAYEYARSGHNVIAGGYLALLSLFGMVMLHEFLAQFEEGAAYVKRNSPKFGLRWITWPTNTFCAAVAWRNYPPAEGTAATVLNAVADLDRIRALKRAARDAKIVGRHQQALAAARRHEELQAAKMGPETAGSTITGSEAAASPTSAAPPRSSVAAGPVEVSRPSDAATPTPKPAASSKLGKEEGREPRGGGMRVPTAAATVMQWATLWVRMCSAGESPRWVRSTRMMLVLGTV